MEEEPDYVVTNTNKKKEIINYIIDNIQDIKELLTDNEKDINNLMEEYIKTITKDEIKNKLIEVVDDTVRVYGDTFDTDFWNSLYTYKIIQKTKIDEPIIATPSGKQKKTKPISKKDLIIIENIKGKLDTKLNNLNTMKEIDMKKKYCINLLKDQILELRGIGFHQLCSILIKTITKTKTVIENEIKLFTYEIIISLEKFIKCENIICISAIDSSVLAHINKNLIYELKIILAELKRISDYNIDTIMNFYPKLIYYSPYDFATINMGYKLYEHQTNIIKTIYDNIIKDIATLLIYKTMTGSGKTTTALGFALLINIMIKNSKFKDFKFVFCCNISNVNTQVAQLCYNMGITIGIVNLIESDILIDQISIGHNPLSMYICNNKSYQKLLDTRIIDKDRIILFFDEPTFNMELEPLNFDIMKNLPKWTILSSTTFPQLDDTENIIKINHMESYPPNAVYSTILSSDIYIGSEIITNTGDVYAPFFNINNMDVLKKVIERIKNNPIITRSFTKEMLDNMNTILGEPKINKLIQANEIKNKVMFILENKVSPENIGLLCSSENILKKDSIKYDELYQKSEKYLGMTMIATIDPVIFALKNFQKLLSDIKLDYIKHLISIGYSKDILDTMPFNKIFSIIVAQYTSSLEQYTKDKTKLEKQKGIKPDQKYEDIENLKSRISFYFNTSFHINSANNIKKKGIKMINDMMKPFDNIEIIDKLLSNVFSKSLTHEQNKVSMVGEEQIDLEIILIILLLCGIGVYAKQSTIEPNNMSINLSKSYTDYVSTLAKNGKLTYLISDSTLVYGTNYPINRIFITKEFSDVNSRETIFQLMSRAGRVGKSWKAEIYIDNTLLDSLDDYFKNDTSEKSEVKKFKKLLGITETQLAPIDTYKHKYLKYKNKYLQVKARTDK
jgi:hypothetical protein